ncbi:MAG: helix-turn-helix domain-containing protein [Desulfobacterales bacterium]
MAEGISAGPRPDLVGGGLVRSVGGWSALKAYRKIGIRIKGDERILGSSDFVEKTLEKANERLAEKTRIKAVGPDLDSLVEKVAVYFKIDTEDLKTASKERRISRARSILSYLAVRKMMISCAEVARALNISPSAVSKAVIKGRALIDRKQIQKQLLDF